MAKTTIVSNQTITNKIKNANNNRPNTVKSDLPCIVRLNSNIEEFKKAAPEHIDATRIVRIAVTAIRRDRDLALCSPESVVAAVMTSVQAGVEPNTPLGQAYIQARKSNNKYYAQFTFGYHGLLMLAYNTGLYKLIDAKPVYREDEFHIAYGREKPLVHIPNYEDRDLNQEPTVYYANYETVNGGYNHLGMGLKEIVFHMKKYSPSWKFGAWKTNFSSMALKTVLKQLLKYAPKDVRFQKIFALDDSVKSQISEDMSEVPNEDINWENNNNEDGEDKENNNKGNE